MKVLDRLYIEPKLKYSDFYNFSPFKNKANLQNPGSVISMLLSFLSDAEKEHLGYEKEMWVKYKTKVLKNICSMITAESLALFSIHDCVMALHKLSALCVSYGQAMTEFPYEALRSLFKTFYQLRNQASPEALADALWSLGKLCKDDYARALTLSQIQELINLFHSKYKESSVSDINKVLFSLAHLAELEHCPFLRLKQVENLITQFYLLRHEANAQSISIVLWAIGKLMKAEKCDSVQLKQIEDLLSQFHEHLEEAEPQNISNVLWFLATLIENGKIPSLDKIQIEDFAKRLYVHKDRISFHFMCIALWALALIHTTMPFTLPEGFVDHVFNSPDKNNDVKAKNQILQALSFLGLLNKYEVNELIQACQPVSELSPSLLKPYVANASYWKKEAFISGFFVDLLVEDQEKNQIIYEFDGAHHDRESKKAFDHFRDEILKKAGYEIKRISFTHPTSSSIHFFRKGDERAKEERPTPQSKAAKPGTFMRAPIKRHEEEASGPFLSRAGH